MTAAGVLPPSSPRAKRTNALTAMTRTILWARAAGRCQYAGCNKSLVGDLIAGAEDKNFGFVAHIVADTPDGPRGDPVRSPLLSNAVSNLMLLCHPHHKLIDVDDVPRHPEDRLLAMKATHEARIETVTSIHEDRASHVLRYAANIGSYDSPVVFDQISTAMLPKHYPAEGRRMIDIALAGCRFEDHEPAFWDFQRENLQRQFATKVRARIEAGEIHHLSVFALAPQPLLIELGRLLSDIAPADVRQLQREPRGWAWPTDGARMRYRLREGSTGAGPVGLVLALSATVNDDRIASVLGRGSSIWAIEAEQPHNDILKSADDLEEFRRLLRRIFNAIKAARGEQAVINIFPALPVSAAVEVGRVWMPKADLPVIIYDQNRRLGGFIPTLEIGYQPALSRHRRAPNRHSSTGRIS